MLNDTDAGTLALMIAFETTKNVTVTQVVAADYFWDVSEHLVLRNDSVTSTKRWKGNFACLSCHSVDVTGLLTVVFLTIESTKTTFMEDVSTGVLEKIKSI